MRVPTYFVIYFLCYTVHTEPHRTYDAREENEYRMSYFFTKTPRGTYELVDLTKPMVRVRASLVDVTYYFYTQSNKHGVVVKELTPNLSLNIFNPQNDIVITIHGWQNNYLSPFNSNIKSAILDKFNTNVIVVDWSSFAERDYITARYTAPQIGRLVAELIQSLSSMYKIPVSRVSLIGHSLGAHACGIAGSILQGQIDHIIGLDPAGPLVSILDKNFCLDPSDAQYVEVIHTNGYFLGLMTSLGHSDYFPNGGMWQPGCGFDFIGTCSHSRAHLYYAESIRNTFVSQGCASYSDFVWRRCKGKFAIMGGYNVDKKIFGDFYLKTNGNCPYAIR